MRFREPSRSTHYVLRPRDLHLHAGAVRRLCARGPCQSPPLGNGAVVSVKRLTWHLAVLERAKKNLLKKQYDAVRTRLDLAVLMATEMLKQAEGYKAKAMEAKK